MDSSIPLCFPLRPGASDPLLAGLEARSWPPLVEVVRLCLIDLYRSSWKRKANQLITFRVLSTNLLYGDTPFSIYSWQRKGVLSSGYMEFCSCIHQQRLPDKDLVNQASHDQEIGQHLIRSVNDTRELLRSTTRSAYFLAFFYLVWNVPMSNPSANCAQLTIFYGG